ncbi:MAG: hypothetical protein JXR76_03600 [Deltaproteobacteria bacterium]|nr:hypothetical protein [Deltaproteobacteria bacterium]
MYWRATIGPAVTILAVTLLSVACKSKRNEISAQNAGDVVTRTDMPQNVAERNADAHSRVAPYPSRDTDSDAAAPIPKKEGDDENSDTGTKIDSAPIDLASRCTQFKRGVRVGTLFEGVSEVSGMACSTIHPNVLWIHEDSGTVPLL